MCEIIAEERKKKKNFWNFAFDFNPKENMEKQQTA